MEREAKKHRWHASFSVQHKKSHSQIEDESKPMNYVKISLFRCEEYPENTIVITSHILILVVFTLRENTEHPVIRQVAH